MADSTQHKLSRVRPPRVQISYDVEIGDAIEMKELPFVGGILADLSGKPAEPLPKLKDRKFVEIDRDNFNEVMKSIAPRLAFQVENRLADDGSKLNVELNFKEIDDFEPVEVLKQVEPLRKLYDARQRLSDLLTKLDGNDELDALLQDVVASTENLNELKSQAGDSDAAGAAASPEPEVAAEPEAAAEAEEAPADEAPEAEGGEEPSEEDAEDAGEDEE